MAVILQTNKRKKVDGSISVTWRLIIRDYSVNPPKARSVDRKNYHQYGMNPDDSLEVAREKMAALQARNKLTRQAERRSAIEERLEKNATIQSAYLPDYIYSKFLKGLQSRRGLDEIPPKMHSRLAKMREAIAKLDMDPGEWGEESSIVHNWFRRQGLGIDYTNKIIALMNIYAYYYCKEFKKPFLQITKPKGETAVRLVKANLEARQGKRLPAKEIEEEDLYKLQDIPKEQLRWFEFSFYFGLRPHEVDMLTRAKEGKEWMISEARKARSKHEKDRPLALCILQKKLFRVTDERRQWKRIPCILPKQAELIALLRKGVILRRPLVKTLKSRLGEGYGTMTGRKSFSKLMRRYGQKKVDYSRWLGHLNTKTTDRHYDDPDAIDYTPIA